MILLRRDCLVFKTSSGENIPCSVHALTVELVGDSVGWLDKDLIFHAAEAVLHYFKSEKKQGTVSILEFSEALERVLRGLGLNVKTCSDEPAAGSQSTPSFPARVVEADLTQLLPESDGCELLFFSQLRETVRKEAGGEPFVLRFSGLENCVKRLAGARRWSPHCERLSDQIVEFLRNCLTLERGRADCGLVVW